MTITWRQKPGGIPCVEKNQCKADGKTRGANVGRGEAIRQLNHYHSLLCCISISLLQSSTSQRSKSIPSKHVVSPVVYLAREKTGLDHMRNRLPDVAGPRGRQWYCMSGGERLK